MMMKTMAQALAAHGIRVNSVSPGAIKTPINRWPSRYGAADQIESLNELTHHKTRGSTAAVIAPAAVF